MTYVKHFGSRDLKYGVLLGNVRHGNGNAYLFVTGAICARPLLDNEIVFDEDVWTGLYEDIKTYFDNVEIIGWFASMPGMLENDMPEITKTHLDNFAGNDKVCFLIDRVECDDSFYVYDEGEKKNKPNEYRIVQYNDEVIKNTDKENIIGKKRKLPAFAYSASSFMLLAVLLGTVALMNASGQLNELKSVVAGIGGNNGK